MFKKIIILIIISTLVLTPVNISALYSSAEEQRAAIIETAEAYHRQGAQIQYDSYRKNLNITPEDATSQRFLYTVCSGFTYSVYYNTLGIKIPASTEELLSYAKANKEKSDNIIFYYDSQEAIYSPEVLGTATDDEKQNFIEKWINYIKPGDIFVYTVTSGTGHAMMVKSIDLDNKKIELLESGGQKYDHTTHTEKYETEGAVWLTDFKNRLYDNYTKMALIRIITDGKNYINTDNESDTYDGITLSAKSRLDYKGIDIEKTVKISDSTSPIFANIGDKITYTITITNNSETDYSNLNVIENINPELSVVDKGTGTLENNKLKWTISTIEKKKSISLSYTVEIANKRELLGKTIVSTGTVDNIASSKIQIMIGNSLTKEEQQKLLNSFENLKTGSLTERNFINQIYLNALNLDMGLGKLNNLDIISFDKTITGIGNNDLVVKYTKVNDTNIKKYIYNNFYGLRIAMTENESESLTTAWTSWNNFIDLEINDRARVITQDMLLDGDVLLTYTAASPENNELINKAYIYFGNTLYRKTDSTIEEISGDALTNLLNNIIGDNYILLRPSIGLSKNFEVQVPNTLSGYSIIAMIVGNVCIILGASLLATCIVTKDKQNI